MAATWTVILAAGSGTRLARATNGAKKQFLPLDGAPLFWRSARTMDRVARIKGLVFVFPPEEVDEARVMVEGLAANNGLSLPFAVTAGGARRQDSVRNGLAALPRECDRVLVHDSARPFASAALINGLIDALDQAEDVQTEDLQADAVPPVRGVIPALAVTDTIKEVAAASFPDAPTIARRTLDRSTLRAVQTPQAFFLDTLRQAHEQAEAEGWDVTDDASMVERLGLSVRCIDGEPANIKITTPEDLAVLAPNQGIETALPCTGFGYDVHRYATAQEADGPKARPFKLGGVPIPKAPQVLAHSDGDVLLHALADALLGLLGAGDIGDRFPDTDPSWDNMDSAVFIGEILRDIEQAGIRLTHADCTIIAQVPKVAPHKDAIRQALARMLALPDRAVNVKATTEEKLGFTGEKKGVKATAVVTALRPARDTT